MKNLKNILIIFIRNPAFGKVKTRLARALGATEALRIYSILLDKTRLAAIDVKAERHLYYSDFVANNDEWPTALFQKKQQSAGNLGARMEAAFQDVFNAGADKAVIIGSDCPELSGAILEQAFAALDQHDFVIGPVFDGGYYLLGMRRMEPSLFRDISWSTNTVRARTMDKIATLGKHTALLPMLRDIDEAEDWEAYLKSQAL